LLWKIWKHNHHIDWKWRIPMDIKPIRCFTIFLYSKWFAYYYLYNIIVLNLFILVQLLESSCVQMLWCTTKLKLLLPHVPRRLIWLRSSFNFICNKFGHIFIRYSPHFIYLLSIVLYSIPFYHMSVKYALPLVLVTY
jgi:hypothetical protein